MPRCTRLYGLLVALTLGVVAHAAEPSPPPPATLLFAGSSSTYWNDLPRGVAQLVSRKIEGGAGVPVRPEIVGRSGSDIRVYADPDFARYEYGVQTGQSFLEKLSADKPRWVVLQVVARFITGDGEDNPGGAAHAAAVSKYCEAIRAAGGEPVFYEMGWGSSEREAEGRAKILALAVENRIRYYAPCAAAWARVRAQRPELALQHPRDGAHPGDVGHFLNLACFYAALTRTSPVGMLPRTYHVWPHALPKPTTDEEKAAEAAAIAKLSLDAYQQTLPKWMHRHLAASRDHALDDDVAQYLETTAWETWQSVDRQLAAQQEERQ